jgi:hypothetical protein
VYAEQERKMYAGYYLMRKLQHPILELNNLYLVYWYLQFALNKTQKNA